jgi:exodeoxyribonuclease V alpha subunit
VGITLAVPDEDGAPRLRVAFQLPTGDIRLVLPSRLDRVDTVYAMTVHKSQGSEFTHTALILPERDNPVVTRELLYTAITRARAHFTLLTSNPSVANNAIRHPTWRASGLRASL